MGLSFQSGKEQDNSDLLNKVLDTFIQFRDTIRTNAKNKDFGSLLKSCDELRDDILPFLGIRIEDKTGQPSIWKMENAEDLLKQRELMKAEQKKKEEMKLLKEKQKAEKEAKMKISPKELFSTQTDKYSEFNEDGFPTKDKEGKELTKS